MFKCVFKVFYLSIARLHFITNTPVKDVAEQFSVNGFSQKKVIDHLSKHFRRDVRISISLYLGDIQRESVSKKKIYGETGRVSIRFSSDMHDHVVLRFLTYFYLFLVDNILFQIY